MLERYGSIIFPFCKTIIFNLNNFQEVLSISIAKSISEKFVNLDNFMEIYNIDIFQELFYTISNQSLWSYSFPLAIMLK